MNKLKEITKTIEEVERLQRALTNETERVKDVLYQLWCMKQTLNREETLDFVKVERVGKNGL